MLPGTISTDSFAHSASVKRDRSRIISTGTRLRVRFSTHSMPHTSTLPRLRFNFFSPTSQARSWLGYPLTRLKSRYILINMQTRSYYGSVHSYGAWDSSSVKLDTVRLIVGRTDDGIMSESSNSNRTAPKRFLPARHQYCCKPVARRATRSSNWPVLGIACPLSETGRPVHGWCTPEIRKNASLSYWQEMSLPANSEKE